MQETETLEYRVVEDKAMRPTSRFLVKGHFCKCQTDLPLTSKPKEGRSELHVILFHHSLWSRKSNTVFPNSTPHMKIFFSYLPSLHRWMADFHNDRKAQNNEVLSLRFPQLSSRNTCANIQEFGSKTKQTGLVRKCMRIEDTFNSFQKLHIYASLKLYANMYFLPHWQFSNEQIKSAKGCLK